MTSYPRRCRRCVTPVAAARRARSGRLAKPPAKVPAAPRVQAAADVVVVAPAEDAEQRKPVKLRSQHRRRRVCVLRPSPSFMRTVARKCATSCPALPIASMPKSSPDFRKAKKSSPAWKVGQTPRAEGPAMVADAAADPCCSEARMNEIPFRSAEIAKTSPLIQLHHVWKTFITGGDVRVDALRGVSLSIYPGEFVAIMGASGSGKSTLMNLLGCLDRPTSGSYYFAGDDVSEFDADSLAWLRREAFGFVFQSYNLLSTATAEENVEIPAIYAGLSPEERRQRAGALLESLGLGDRLTHRPSQLSGGQQQRVSIARALMNGGQIILADEPTGALDSKSGAEVMALLEELAAEGHTVILITHDASVAAHARRVIELKDGEIVRDSATSKAPALPLGAAANMPQLDHRTGSHVMLTGLSESLRMAMRALRANIFRTVLTLLGIVIGVSSVVAMLAIGEGAKQRVVQQIGSMGTNLLVVRPQFRNARGYNGPIVTMTPDDAKAMEAIPYVMTAMPDVRGAATVRYGNIDYQPDGIVATTDALPQTRSWRVARGIFFTQEDQNSYATVAVLGNTVYESLFPDRSDPIGKYILILH